jgi:hypothetical protein
MQARILNDDQLAHGAPSHAISGSDYKAYLGQDKGTRLRRPARATETKRNRRGLTHTLVYSAGQPKSTKMLGPDLDFLRENWLRIHSQEG